MTQQTDSEDVVRWPDDTWCYRNELSYYGYKSDDYEVLYFDTAAWREFMDAQDYEHH